MVASEVVIQETERTGRRGRVRCGSAALDAQVSYGRGVPGQGRPRPRGPLRLAPKARGLFRWTACRARLTENQASSRRTKMPGRYEMVEEPTLDSELGDEVYNPDQSVPGERPQIRSLEPIVAGPVSLKTIFLDPRWSETQRKACLCSLAAVGLFAAVLLILLLVGLGKVLVHISWMEQMEEHGLAMVPDLSAMLFTSFIYSPAKYRWGATFESQLNLTLAAYSHLEELSDFYEDCEGKAKPSEGHHCRFPIDSILQEGCTAENKFGYEDGRPCLLFRFKHEQEWKPVDVSNKPLKYLPLTCRASINGHREVGLNYTMWPSAGFDTRFFAKGKGLGPQGELVTPEPLVMLQLHNLQDLFAQAHGLPLQVRCQLGTKKPDFLSWLKSGFPKTMKDKKLRPPNFYGIRVVEFDARLAEDIFG